MQTRRPGVELPAACHRRKPHPQPRKSRTGSSGLPRRMYLGLGLSHIRAFKHLRVSKSGFYLRQRGDPTAAAVQHCRLEGLP